MRKRLFGLVIAMAAAFCIAGGMALTAFAQAQQADDQGLTAGSAELATQDEGDVSYQYYDTKTNDFQSGTKASTEYTEVTSAEGEVTWNAGWYVASGNVTIDGRVTVSGEANLILRDGATLTASKGITVASGNTLNIYPGSARGTVAGTGQLIAGASSDGCADYNAAIGGANGNIGGTFTIHGGTVTATGGGSAAGIGGGWQGNSGAVTVYDGNVTATGGWAGAGIGSGNDAVGNGGTFTIYGGTVTATGGGSAAGIGGGRYGSGSTLTVYGGDVTATGGWAAAGIGGGEVLDISNTTLGAGGDVLIYSGNVTAIGGDGAVGIGRGAGSAGSSGNITLGERVTLETSGDGETWSEPTIDTSIARTRYMRAIYDPPVIYQAWNESNQRVETVVGGCTDGAAVTSATTAFENGKWYVVSGNVTIDDRITVSGTAHLILRDGATLTASKGITVASGNTLNIYPGSTRSTVAGTGRLYAGCQLDGNTLTVSCDSSAAGIGGVAGDASKNGGTVTIHGGAVIARGGTGAAGIGGGSGGAGGTVNIYSGAVNTAGDEGAMGIGAGSEGGSNGTFNPIGAAVYTSSNNTEWIAYDSTAGRARYMRTLDTYSITLSGGANATASGSLEQSVTEFQPMADVTFTADAGYIFADSIASENNGITMTRTSETTITVSGKPTANVNITIPDAVPAPVTYQAWDENDKTMKSVDLGSGDYYVVDANTKNLTSDKPYVASGNVTIDERITVEGAAHLILRDGATLTASKGITVNCADVDNGGASDNVLNIYAQSAGESKGQLIAGVTGDNGIADGNAGIGGIQGETSAPATCGTVNIHGGAVTATGGVGDGSSGGAAGIGGGFKGDGGAVTVYGGTVTANGGNFAAGIGSGDSGGSGWVYNAGTFTVYGGTVTANGGNYGAGIGGGRNGDHGSVNIHGGTVTANGGTNGGMYGAGIGSGAYVNDYGHSTGSTVTIDGGTVTATGGDSAAGIGGGYSGDSGTVIISGGTVEAVGGKYGAGIGGGIGGFNSSGVSVSGHCGKVTINGGTVTATGGERAAGIGGGVYGNGGEVIVNGGTVKATGSVGVHNSNVIAGIGGGDYAASLTTSGTLELGQGVALYGGESSTEKALLAAESGFYGGTRYTYMEATGADVQPVPYQAWDAESGTVKNVEGGRASYTVVDTSTTAFGGGKWYVVSGEAVINDRITVTGEANLILCDNATLTVAKGIYVRYSDENNDGKSDNILNIYAQSGGKSMGALTATGEQWGAGIGGGSGNAGGTVNIHGGTVTANGGMYGGAGIGGGSGGDGGTVTIYGGLVTANGGSQAAGIGHGANRAGNGTLTLADSALPMVVSDDNVHWYAYSTTEDNRAQYMKPAGTVSVTLTVGAHATYTGTLEQTVAEGESIVAVTFTADAGYVFEKFTPTTKNGITMTWTDEKTITVSGAPTATTNITIPDAVPAPITYQAWDEDAKEMKTFHLDSGDYHVVDANTKKLAYDKPNVVSSDVTISDRITLIGNSATLIICDGATLTASGGIYVPVTDMLNIYPGSTGESVEGTGTLKATGSDNAAGIGGENEGEGGTVVIHGGNVEAIGGANAAGIGSGSRYSEGTVANRGCNVTVYGGTVKATGSANSVGIGAGDYGNQHGALTLNGMALYGGESAAAKVLIVGSLNGGYGGSRKTYMEIGPAVVVEPIPYQAWNADYEAVLNVDGGCTSYIAMDANTTTLGGGNWYVLSSDAAVPDRITVSGTAHLIICDGATLTASKGINVAKGSMLTAANDISTSGATLNIYTQSRGENAGKLIAGASNNGCSDYNAAIGGGNTEAGGTLNIHGGTVTAIGGRLAAGIGGGYHGDGGTINVYSGTVTATGGEQAAGIGGGSQGGAGGNISIHGGDVIAAGGANAAGIGGGSGGAGGTVIIRNSDVTAVGGQGAAGIGGGSAGAGGTVTIYNSAVDATGGQGGAGVGGGSQGDGGNVNITGGTVVTAAGEGAEGIGSGDGGGDHGSLSLGASLALYGGDSPDLTALAEKGVIQSKTHYVRSRYMTALDAVKGVTIVVDKLPGPDTVTTADKETVMNAQAAFGDLTADQKAKVPADTLKKLTDVEKALAAAEKEAADKEAADAAAAKIDALPPADKVTPDDKAAIEAARAAYDALTMEQKAILDEDPSVLDYLVAAEKALAKAEADKAAADAVAGKIDALPEAGKVTIADKTAIEAARTAYDALTMEQKAILDEDPSILAYLMAAEEALKAAEEAVATPIDGAAIAAIPDQVYTAAPVEPALEVTLGGKELAAGADYDVAYADNVEVSTATSPATVTVTGKGAYKGTATATFKVTSLAKKEAATRMRDLDPGAWYMGGDGTRGGFFGPESDTLYMDYTLARGLISGFKDASGNVTGFGPDGDLSRAQAAVIIYRMANPGSTDTYSDVAAAGIANTSGLPDVEGGRYYTAAVNWCVKRGIVTGYTDAAGRPYAFGPEDRVTREQLATFIGRYMDPQGAAGSDVSGFSDGDQISGYARAGIAYCNANGIMTGVGGTRAFDPQGNASRCQMAKVIAVTDRLRTE